MSLRRRRWSTSADAPFRNERRPLNESRRRRPKHPFVRESMETACNACCRRFFHVGRFLTDDLFPGFMMPSDPAVRSRRPIPPSDPAVRSRRPIPPSDPAVRSRRSIRPSDPAVRSLPTLLPTFLPAPSRLFSFPCIPPCNTPGASPALLRRSALHLSDAPRRTPAGLPPFRNRAAVQFLR